MLCHQSLHEEIASLCIASFTEFLRLGFICLLVVRNYAIESYKQVFHHYAEGVNLRLMSLGWRGYCNHDQRYRIPFHRGFSAGFQAFRASQLNFKSYLLS